MPTYTYACDSCGHGPEDRLVPMASRAAQFCPKCGLRMGRRIGAPAVRTRPPKDGGPDRFGTVPEPRVRVALVHDRDLELHRHGPTGLEDGAPVIRDGRQEAMYALFDRTAARLTFVRVAYDHVAAARAIRAPVA